jgi:preprotein translocase subunit SecG
MSEFITAVHIIVCIILIIAVLLQSGKSADLAGAFGGSGSQTVFGPRGAATILSKVTTICAVLFMLTSLGLWMLSAKGTGSVVGGEEAPAKEAPAATETKAGTKAKKEAPPPEAKGTEKKKEGVKTEQKKEKKKETTEKKKEEKISLPGTYAEVVELVDTLA